MSKSIVYLAVAGAGKTYTICNSIDSNKRNLILSYTNENIMNIIKELKESKGYTLENTIVMTFDSFLLSYFIWPYLNRIEKELFNMTESCEKKISLLRQAFDKDKRWQMSKTNRSHYFLKNQKNEYSLILSNCADLVLSDLRFANKKSLFDLGMERIKMFYDCIYIDEFQDYRQSKYDLMVKIMNNIDEGYLYGDYFQHSVSGQTNFGKPFSSTCTYAKFKNELVKNGFVVNETALSQTRRCSEQICAFIRDKFNIEIYSNPEMNRMGDIRYVFDSNELKSIMLKEKVIVLFLEKNYYKTGITFGISKGNTYENIIVIVPDSNLINAEGKKELKVIENNTKNKLYVALTRATGNVYLTDKKTINAI